MANSFFFEAFRIGWLIDGTGASVSENVTMFVRGPLVDRIEPGFQEGVDLSEYTVIPALIDCHVHLFMSATTDMDVRKRQLEAGYDEIEPVIEEHVRRHATHGVAAVRDGADRLGHAMRYRNSKRNAKGPPVEIKVAGRAWNQPGRYGKLIGRAPMPGESLAQAIENDLARLAPVVPDHVKIVNSGINSLKNFGKQTPPQFELKEMGDAVALCASRNLPVMVHANGEEPVRIAVEAGCSSIEHGFFAGEDNLKRMADRGTVWVPTACTMKGYAETLPPKSPEADTALKYLDHQVEQMALGRKLGTRMALGTDAGTMGVRHGSSVLEELKLFGRAGFGVEVAIFAAAGQAARLLNIEDLGELVSGKKACFIAVKGRPENLFANFSEQTARVFGFDLRGSRREFAWGKDEKKDLADHLSRTDTR